MASSTDGESMADDLVDSCKEFFNQDSAALSDQELSLQLEGLGAYDVSFGRGTVQSILIGGIFDVQCSNVSKQPQHLLLL